MDFTTENRLLGPDHFSAKVKAKYFFFHVTRKIYVIDTPGKVLENHMKSNKMLHDLGQIIDCKKRESL